jgi:hypothetical protein
MHNCARALTLPCTSSRADVTAIIQANLPAGTLCASHVLIVCSPACALACLFDDEFRGIPRSIQDFNMLKSLQDNPLLTKKLDKAHIKKRLLGHWGTTTGWLARLGRSALKSNLRPQLHDRAPQSVHQEV